jgi:hypothetical protein
MMGFNSAAYQVWIEAAGHQKVEDLFTYALPIDQGLPGTDPAHCRDG